MSGGRWLTRANGLTLLRLLLAPVFFHAILDDDPLLASGVFFLAVATDLADGWVARRFGESSPFGGLADHAVDATFVTVGAAALACQGLLPTLLPPLIAAAFLQYAFDSRTLGSRLPGSRVPEGRGLVPSALGRWNGIAYFVIVAVPPVRDVLGWGWPGEALVMALGWALVVSTLVSMGDRLRRLASARRAPGSPA